MPAVQRLQLPARAGMGVAVEGDARAWPGGTGAPPVLPVLDSAGQTSRYLEVFARGARPVRWSASAAQPWVRLSQRSGETAEQSRIEVGVDWASAPRGAHRVQITVRGSDGTAVTVIAPVSNGAPAAASGFMESDGYVAMEAANYARAVGGGGVSWRTIPELGRTLSGVTPFPVTAPAQTPGGAGPRLEYAVTLAGAGEVEIRVVLAPTLDFKGQGGLRYAVSIDDGPIQVVNVHADGSEAAWERSVADNARVLASRHRVSAPGAHTVKIWMVDPGLVFERVLVVRGQLPPSYLGPPESRRAAGDR